MDDIKISEEHVAAMDAVAPGIFGLRIVFVNVYAVTHPDNSWTLIDAGLPFSEGFIHRWAEKRFEKAPNAIILTHGHFDHVGAARQLAERWNAPIWAHPLEFPYLTGKEKYPPPNAKAGGGLMSALAPIYPRGPIDLGSRLQPLPPSSSPVGLTLMPGWQILHTPGHTPGHVSFFRPDDKALLVGDAFCTTKPESFFEAALAQQTEIHGPPAYFTSDWRSARESVCRLAELRPGIIAPGHGKALTGAGLDEALLTLAANFDRLAVPAKATG
jgi:glyoxylase-like metal-dependent hydrolase (beta-lactamase superfamily II)